MNLECACGEKGSLPMLGVPFACRCGITYTATVNVEEMHRRQRALVREVEGLTKFVEAMKQGAGGTE